MSQSDFSLANQSGAAYRSDNNDALQALASLSSGTSAPSTTYAYQLWYDTGNGLLKIRNGGNSAWLTIGNLVSTTKFEIYVNNSVKVTVDSSGNMGIGNASPVYDLDVTGDINFTGSLYQGGVAFSASPTSISKNNTSATVTDTGANGQFTVTIDGTDSLIVTKDKELLLNIASPVTNAIATLTKSATAVNMMAVGNGDLGHVKIGTNTSGSDYQCLPNGGAAVYTSAACDIAFGTNNTEICRLKNSNGTLTFASGKYPVAKNVTKAWANFSDTSGIGIVLNDSFNVSSITSSSSNNYRLNFTVAMSDTNYCCVGNLKEVSGKAPIVVNASLTTGYAQVYLKNGTGDLNSTAVNVCVMVLGA